MDQNIRESAVAGQFYPLDKTELENLINDLSKKAPVPHNIKTRIKGLIVPHAGYVYSGLTAVSAYKYLQETDFDEIFLLGPSHYYPADKITLANYQYWKTPLVLVKSSPRIKEIEKLDNFIVDNVVHQDEHSLEVQLPFLQTFINNNFNIIPMLVNNTHVHEVALTLAQLVDDNDLFVISSDLSHYYSDDIAKTIDKKSINAILELDSSIVAGNDFEACGHMSIAIMLEIIKMKDWNIELIDYKTSGDIVGDKSRVVGYGSFVIYE